MSMHVTSERHSKLLALILWIVNVQVESHRKAAAAAAAGKFKEEIVPVHTKVM
jgi:hypothetical protein